MLQPVIIRNENSHVPSAAIPSNKEGVPCVSRKKHSLGSKAGGADGVRMLSKFSYEATSNHESTEPGTVATP